MGSLRAVIERHCISISKIWLRKVFQGRGFIPLLGEAHETDIFERRFASSAPQKFYCSCFYLVLSFVCINSLQITENSLKFATVYFSSFVICFHTTAEI